MSFDDQFKDVQRLLALKRYECPPPGHLARIARNIRATLKTEPRDRQSTWWDALLNQLDLGPAWAAALALAVAVAYFYGWTWSHRAQTRAEFAPAIPTQRWIADANPFWSTPFSSGSERAARVHDQLDRPSIYPILGMEPVRGWRPSSNTRGIVPVDYTIRSP